ncbi:hypothetical protein C3L33_11405, partial [Rhododendron williamsianum]
MQREIISIANSIVEEAIVGILCTNFPESLGVADLGCSSGPNTFIISSEVIDIVHATSRRLGRPIPELRVSLNDLPGNDFNCIFKALPEFYKKLKEEKGGGFDRCFVSGVPGSFYGRLFPSKSLHFGLVEEEKIDSFNAPYYAPCPEELKFVVQTDGSFLVDRLETFEFYWEDQMKTEFEELSSGQRVAKTVRAVVESMLECHFGREILDVLFRRYGEIVDDHLSRNRAEYVDLVVSLIRMG